MPFFLCPNCNSELFSPAEVAGTLVCPDCGAAIDANKQIEPLKAVLIPQDPQDPPTPQELQQELAYESLWSFGGQYRYHLWDSSFDCITTAILGNNIIWDLRSKGDRRLYAMGSQLLREVGYYKPQKHHTQYANRFPSPCKEEPRHSSNDYDRCSCGGLKLIVSRVCQACLVKQRHANAMTAEERVERQKVYDARKKAKKFNNLLIHYGLE